MTLSSSPRDSTDSTSPESEPRPGARRRISRGEFANRYALVGVLVVIVALFSILKPRVFPTLSNAQTIAGTQAVVTLLALAAMLPLIVGEFDISIAFQLGFSQALCAGLAINDHWPVLLAAVVAVAACVAVGVINGLLVIRVRLNSFTATLATGSLVLGLTEFFSGDQTITGNLPSTFVAIGRNSISIVPLPFVYVLVAAAILWTALEFTTWGRECHATGGNARAALLAGVRTDRVTMQCFVLAGLLSGLSGVLSVMILGASSPSVGLGELLPAYAGAFLGATAVRPGRFNAIGTVLAIYVLATGITGLQLLGAQFYVSDLFNGGALLIAITLSTLIGRRRRDAVAP
jgi:ribose transport system permease protein